MIFHHCPRIVTNQCDQAFHAVVPHNQNVEFCVAQNRKQTSAVIALRVLNELDENQILDFDGK